MNNSTIPDPITLRRMILDRIGQRLQRMGMAESDVSPGLDLVRSGLLDSLGFVDLVADLEQATGRRADLESALTKPGATTVQGITELFTT